MQCFSRNSQLVSGLRQADPASHRIAEAAEVSVGSLYQYFPSKEALVLVVILRHNDALMFRT